MILENIAGLARPVRIVAKSSLATETAFSIFSSASKRVSSITSVSVSVGDGLGPSRGASGVGPDERADLLTVHRARDVAVVGEVEDDDREPVVTAQADGCPVSHLQAPGQELVVGQLV